MRINNKARHLQDWITQVWVKLTGRKIKPENYSWLLGPVGGTKLIDKSFIYDLAEKENLEIKEDIPDSGLLDDFKILVSTSNDGPRLNKRIIEFYEKTSNFNFEIWSEWCGFFRPFGWLLSRIFSVRLQQLNLPLSSM